MSFTLTWSVILLGDTQTGKAKKKFTKCVFTGLKSPEKEKGERWKNKYNWFLLFSIRPKKHKRRGILRAGADLAMERSITRPPSFPRSRRSPPVSSKFTSRFNSSSGHSLSISFLDRTPLVCLCRTRDRWENTHCFANAYFSKCHFEIFN